MFFRSRISDGSRCLKKKSVLDREKGYYCTLLRNTSLPTPLYCLQYCAIYFAHDPLYIAIKYWQYLISCKGQALTYVVCKDSAAPAHARTRAHRPAAPHQSFGAYKQARYYCQYFIAITIKGGVGEIYIYMRNIVGNTQGGLGAGRGVLIRYCTIVCNNASVSVPCRERICFSKTPRPLDLRAKGSGDVVGSTHPNPKSDPSKKKTPPNSSKTPKNLAGGGGKNW